MLEEQKATNLRLAILKNSEELLEMIRTHKTKMFQPYRVGREIIEGEKFLLNSIVTSYKKHLVPGEE